MRKARSRGKGACSTQQLPQRAARHELHHEDGWPSRHDRQRLDDIWVFEPSQDLALAHEARDILRVLDRQTRLQALDRNSAAVISVAAFVHLTHGSFGDEGDRDEPIPDHFLGARR